MSTYYRLLTVKEGHERGLSEDIDALSAEKAKRKQILDATISYEDGEKYPEIVATEGWDIEGKRTGSGQLSYENLELIFFYDSPADRPKQFVLEVDAEIAPESFIFFQYGGGTRVHLRFQSIERFLGITAVRLWGGEYVESASFWTNFRKCKETDA